MIHARVLVFALLASLLALAPGCSRRATPEQVQEWSAEIGRLQAQQDSLRARAAELVAQDMRIQRLPKGDVVVVVPTSFLRRVVERVFSDVVDNVTLQLSGLKAHTAKSVKKVVTIGEFVLDVDSLEVVGKLRPGTPDIRFGGDRMSMTLPIALREGRGGAKLHFIWDGKNVAGMTCGDMDLTQRVTGSALPADYVVSGSMDFEVRGNRILCTPVFPETRLRVQVEPSRESWAAVDSILAAKRGVCGWVLDKVDVPSLLKGIVQEKGINVKLPVDKLKPFALPGGVRDTVTVGERRLAFDTRTRTLRIDHDAVWYSADAIVRSR